MSRGSSPYGVTMEYQGQSATRELYYIVHAEGKSEARDRARNWAKGEGKQDVAVKSIAKVRNSADTPDEEDEPCDLNG